MVPDMGIIRLNQIVMDKMEEAGKNKAMGRFAVSSRHNAKQRFKHFDGDGTGLLDLEEVLRVSYTGVQKLQRYLTFFCFLFLCIIYLLV